jgi:hypothetical protein
MAYTPLGWVDSPSTVTPVDAANLNYMEAGIQVAAAAADSAAKIAGDLAGTAAAPSVAKVAGVAITGTPTAGQVPTATSGTAAAWATPAAGGSSAVNPVYGDGSDGTTTINSNTLLTRSMFYQNLTIAPGVIVDTNQLRIVVRGTLTVGAGAVIHTDGKTGYALAGLTGRGGIGGGMSNTVGGNGQASNTYVDAQYGGNGGAGGAGSGGAGGSGGVVPAPNQVSAPSPRSMSEMVTGTFYNQVYQGGAGGGAGGGDATKPTTGGAGGSGGNVLIIVARFIVNNGTIRSAGGAGQPRLYGTDPGGGGGGGGGLVLVTCDSFTGNPPTAPAGVGGLAYGETARGTGIDGSPGLPGIVIVSNGAVA